MIIEDIPSLEFLFNLVRFEGDFLFEEAARKGSRREGGVLEAETFWI